MYSLTGEFWVRRSRVKKYCLAYLKSRNPADAIPRSRSAGRVGRFVMVRGGCVHSLHRDPKQTRALTAPKLGATFAPLHQSNCVQILPETPAPKAPVPGVIKMSGKSAWIRSGAAICGL